MTHNLTAENLCAHHYEQAIADLQLALAQHQSIERGEAQADCAVCGDNGHTADSCWFHNPLLLALLGDQALTGAYWRCFHCGALYTDETSARAHFGDTQDEVAKCVRDLAECGGAQ